MKYTKIVLKNGLRIITVPVKDSPTVTAYCLVETGSKYEEKPQNGISHFLEHMCFKGTTNRSRDEIVFELDSIGASYNAFTSFEYTGYYAKAHHEHAVKLLDVISDIYLNSTFPEEEMEKEKGVVIEEIKMYEDLPQHKVDEVLLEVMFGDQPAGWSIAGSPENIRNLKREDVAKYHAEHYVPKATVVIVAGKFNEKKLIKEVEQRFAAFPKKPKADKLPTIERQKKPSVLVLPKETDQTHLLIGIRSFDMYDKRQPVLEVLSSLLGGGMSSRLFRRMRDELGICYYIRSHSSEYTDHGILEISAGVPAARIGEAVDAITKELKAFKEELVTPAELKKVKDYIIGHLFMGLESSDAYGFYFGNQEVFHQKIKTPEEWAKKIRAVKASDIKKLAGELFQNDRLNLGIVGPITEEAVLRKVLRF